MGKFKTAKTISSNKWFILLSLIIIGTPLLHIGNHHGLSLLNDEFGYWSTAAVINGYQWSDLIEFTPYYSAGYGLILGIILHLFPNTEVAYNVSIVINALLMWISFYLLINIGKLIFDKISDRNCIIFSAISILLPNLQIYGQYSWPEPLIVTLYIIMSYLLLLMAIRRNRQLLYLSIGLLSGTILMLIHPRGQFVFYIYIIVLFVYLIRAKSYKSIGALVVFSCIAILLSNILKTWTLNNVWSQSSDFSSINNISLDSTSILGLVKNIIDYPNLFIISLMGKVEVSLIVSGFIISLPIWNAINIIVKLKRGNTFNEPWGLLLAWLLLTFGIMMVLTSLRTLFWMERKDNIVYSRYFDFSLIPLIFIGWGLFNSMGRKKYIPLMSGILLSIVIFPYIASKIYEIPTGFNYICSTTFGSFLLSFHNLYDLLRVVESIQILLLAVFGTVYLKDSNIPIESIYVSLFLLANIVIYSIVIQKLEMNRLEDQRRIESISSYIKNEELEKVNYIFDTNVEIYPYDIKLIQFLNPSLEINVVVDEGLDEFTADSKTVYILNSSIENLPSFLEESEATVASDNLALYDLRG